MKYDGPEPNVTVVRKTVVYWCGRRILHIIILHPLRARGNAHIIFCAFIDASNVVRSYRTYRNHLGQNTQLLLLSTAAIVPI